MPFTELRLVGKMSLSHKAIYDQSVFILDAPVDLLYTACSILEWAAGLIQEFDSVRAEYSTEENQAWRTLRRWSLQNGVPCVDDEDGLTLGMETSKTWTLDGLPSVESVGRVIVWTYSIGLHYGYKWEDDHIENAVCHLSK